MALNEEIRGYKKVADCVSCISLLFDIKNASKYVFGRYCGVSIKSPDNSEAIDMHIDDFFKKIKIFPTYLLEKIFSMKFVS